MDQQEDTDEDFPENTEKSSLPPRQQLPPFEALRAFDAVSRMGGIRKAAHKLNRNYAAVSRHLRSLEAWTGVRLIERTPAGVLLTEDGKAYHREISGAIDKIADATANLMKVSDDNQLHLWCMPAFAYHWLMGHMDKFEGANPDFEIELRPTHTLPDFARHEADADIRLDPYYGNKKLEYPPNVRTVQIAEPTTIAVASAEYLSNAPTIKTINDFVHHRLLHEEDHSSWHDWLKMHGGPSDIELSGSRLWHGHLTLESARRGRGIALTNQFVIADDIAAGDLVEVTCTDQELEPKPLGAYVFAAAETRWNTPPIARFRVWLERTIRAWQKENQRGR